ncbi:MAG: class I SAM-dependent methyltransferase [Pseudomonadota bacterium]
MACWQSQVRFDQRIAELVYLDWKMDVKEEDILGDAVADHWYYRAKTAAMLRVLGKSTYPTVFDVGAGSGVFSKALLADGRAEEAFCIDPAYPEDRKTYHEGRGLNFLRSPPSAKADLVLMMDVLEHVEDDDALLATYVDQLKPGGKVFVTVPAFQSLWSGHDVFLEHYRRYRRTEVDDLLGRAGLKVRFSCYFYGSLFPIAYLKRSFDRMRLDQGAVEPKSDLSLAPKPLNELLVYFHLAELAVMFPWNKFAGLSVVCLGEKAR